MVENAAVLLKTRSRAGSGTLTLKDSPADHVGDECLTNTVCLAAW